MKNKLYSIVVGLSIFLATGTVNAEETFDLGAGHWGGEFNIMPGGPLNGSMLTSLVYESKKVEVAVGYNFFESRGATSNEQQNAEIRAGERFEVGHWAYVNLGIDYAPSWGTASGVSTAGTYTLGPYVGFSRQFPNSNVLFDAFVVPYEYQYSTGTTGATISNAFMLDGGIGIDYLF